MNIIYENSKVEQYIKKSGNLLRKLDKNDHLEVGRKYYNIIYTNFKVLDKFEIDGNEYYEISYNCHQTRMKSVVPYPVNLHSDCYEIIPDIKNIKKENIVNMHINLYGYIIKYWFCINEIEYNDDRYIGFKNKIKHLNDNARYRIRRNKKLNIYDFIQQKS